MFPGAGQPVLAGRCCFVDHLPGSLGAVPGLPVFFADRADRAGGSSRSRCPRHESALCATHASFDYVITTGTIWPGLHLLSGIFVAMPAKLPAAPCVHGSGGRKPVSLEEKSKEAGLRARGALCPQGDAAARSSSGAKLDCGPHGGHSSTLLVCPETALSSHGSRLSPLRGSPPGLRKEVEQLC